MGRVAGRRGAGGPGPERAGVPVAPPGWVVGEGPGARPVGGGAGGRARRRRSFRGGRGGGTRGSVLAAQHRAPPAKGAGLRLGRARALPAAPARRRRNGPAGDSARRGSRTPRGRAAAAVGAASLARAAGAGPSAASSRRGARGPRDSRAGRRRARLGGGPPSGRGSQERGALGLRGARLAPGQQTTSHRGMAPRRLGFPARGLEVPAREAPRRADQASGGRVSTQRTAWRISAVASRSPSFSFRWLRCTSTVLGLRCSSAAISRVPLP